LFKKIKDGVGQVGTGATGEGQLGVSGMPVDPAILGGPSTQPLSPDDPLLQPINGIGIPEYAHVAKEAQARGITDEGGVIALSGELGYDPAVFGPAMQEWISRMGQSMVVGQEFRRAMGY